MAGDLSFALSSLSRSSTLSAFCALTFEAQTAGASSGALYRVLFHGETIHGTMSSLATARWCARAVGCKSSDRRSIPAGCRPAAHCSARRGKLKGIRYKTSQMRWE
jgi:hypothetical protein